MNRQKSSRVKSATLRRYRYYKNVAEVIVLKKAASILFGLVALCLLALGTVGAFSDGKPTPLSLAEGRALLEIAFDVKAEQLGLPKEVRSNKPMTRQEFAHYLFQGVLTTGDYAFTEQYIMISDQKQIKAKYADSIQKLLISQIVTLDERQNFYPNKPITRSEAFGWIYRALEFVQSKQQPAEQPLPIPHPVPNNPLSEMKVETKAINDQVKQVILSAQAPHPGYGLQVTAVQFIGDQAIIHTDVILPDPDRFYPQVVTEVQAITYIPSTYKPVLAQDGQISPGKNISSPDLPVSHKVQ